MTWTKRSTDGIYTFEHDGQQVDVMMNGRCQHPAVIAQAIHDVLRVLDEVDGDPARLDINAQDSGRGATEDNPYTFGPPCADALEAAKAWLTDDAILNAYLADRASDEAFRLWCDDQIREGLAERARLEAG